MKTNLALNSRTDIKALKNTLRAACDAVGVRLGNNNHNVDTIIATLFGAENMHALCSAVDKTVPMQSSPSNEIDIDRSYRHCKRELSMGYSYEECQRAIRDACLDRTLQRLFIGGTKQGSQLLVLEGARLQVFVIKEKVSELLDLINEVEIMHFASAIEFIPHQMESLVSKTPDEAACVMWNSERISYAENKQRYRVAVSFLAPYD